MCSTGSAVMCMDTALNSDGNQNVVDCDGQSSVVSHKLVFHETILLAAALRSVALTECLLQVAKGSSTGTNCLQKKKKKKGMQGTAQIDIVY